MSQQYNKVIKRKRLVAYRKRRKLALRAALAAKGIKPAKKEKS